ncbi:hypothetical protein ACNQFZ_19995 [Schinkia sp. CFF1]
MGFWSSVGSFVSKAVSSTVKAVSNIVRSPIPPIVPGPTLSDLFTMAKKIYNFFKNKRYDSNNASVEETKEVNRDLAEYAKTFHKDAERVEAELMTIANDYFDKVISQLEDMQEVDSFLKQLPIKDLKKEAEDLRKKIKGSIKKEIDHAFSLDNYELTSILSIHSDSDRERNISQFSNNVMKTAVNNFMEKIEELSDRQQEMVQELILSRVDQISKTIQNQNKLLDELQHAKSQDETELEGIKEKISYTMDLCDLAVKELQSVR